MVYLLKMKNNFWKKLERPIYALAPMAGVADSAFRQICKSFGADVLYSEMASVTALVYAPEKTLEMLEFSKVERPYVAQLFGSDPKHFAHATKLITKKLKPDGIDINFGCPVKKVQKQGAGAVLMNDLKLSKKIIKSVIDNTNLPVSIKTRTKVGKVNILKFLDNVRDLDIKAVMIHGRTLNQGFTGEVDFRIIKKAKDYFKGVILANGGVNSAEDAKELLKKIEADGIGIARGTLGKPWIFNEIKEYKSPQPPLNKGGANKCRNAKFCVCTKKEIFEIALKHAKLVEKLKGAAGIREMRKHLCWYAQGLPNARKLRQELVKVENLKDIRKALK